MYFVIKYFVIMLSVYNFCLSRYRVVWCKNYIFFLFCIDLVLVVLFDFFIFKYLNRDIGDIGYIF